jgi:hypothetical protein
VEKFAVNKDFGDAMDFVCVNDVIDGISSGQQTKCREIKGDRPSWDRNWRHSPQSRLNLASEKIKYSIIIMLLGSPC